MLKLTESLSVRVEPSKAKDHLLSTFMKYMQIAVLTRKEDTISSVQLGQFKQDGTREARFQGTLEEKKDKVLSILSMAVSSLYHEDKHREFWAFLVIWPKEAVQITGCSLILNHVLQI